MTIITPTINVAKPYKIATLTAFATACTLLFSAPAIAENSSAVPSAIDSSQRVIRYSQANTTPSTAQITAAMVQPVSATRAYQTAPVGNMSHHIGMIINSAQLGNLPTPQLNISSISFIPTTLIAQTQKSNSSMLDVSLLDDLIAEVSPNARHYPPNFPNRTQRHNAREKIKVMAEWIDVYANAPDASYEVLIRAAKLNGMGRNLDLGSNFALRGGTYVDRAIKAQPNSAEANFIYGIMLSEGGGFKEGQKYLDKAASLGYTEAEQSLAQSDLLSDRRNQALDRLRRLALKVPDNSVIHQQIKLVEDGKYYIWDLPASSLKPSI